jgi:hypothetical protein
MKVTKGIFALLMLPFEMESDCVLSHLCYYCGREKNSMWHSVLSIILFHSMALFFFVEVSVVAFCYSMSNREYVKAASDELQHCGF